MQLTFGAFSLNNRKSQSTGQGTGSDKVVRLARSSEFAISGEPPENEDSGLVVTPLKMPRDLRNELDIWAKRRGLSRSAAINLCIAKAVRGLD